MRATLVLLALVLSLMQGAPAANAAGHLLEDPKGDTQTVANAQGQATPSVATPAAAPSGDSQSDSTDMLSLDVTESADDLTFTMTVSSLAGSFTGSSYLTYLTWGDKQYRFDMHHYVGIGGDFDGAFLLQQEAAKWNTIAQFPVKVDLDKGTVASSLPKVFLLDSQQRMPLQGDVLKDVHVDSDRTLNLNTGVSAGGLSIVDHMPDSGAGATITILKGDVASGALRLTAPERVRVSNGGATTFVYKVGVANGGGADEDVQIAVTDLPPDWTSKAPSTVHVPAKSNQTFTVLASVPFAHKHGGFDAFTVGAKSPRDASSFATVRLGVLHTPIPQPAGHHAELYLHGAAGNGAPFNQVFTYATMWMSTEAAHDSDAATIPANNCQGDPGTHAWNVPLNPGLAIGIDFDLAKVGSLAGSIVGNTKGTGSIAAKLWLVDEGEGQIQNNGVVAFDKQKALLLADSGAPAPLALDLNNPVAWSLKITPRPEADYIPFTPHKNLWMEITYKNDQSQLDHACSGIGPIVPALVPKDLKMSLPLNEYQDRLDGVAEAASVIAIKAEGVVEKMARPGTTMTYSFTVSNTGLTSDEVTLEAAGNDAKLATVVPGGVVKLDPKGTQAVLVGVKIPKDAAPGASYEVLLFAHSKADPSRTAVARTKTIVGTGADAKDDEAAILTKASASQKKSPGVETLGALAMVGAAAVLASRRRR